MTARQRVVSTIAAVLLVATVISACTRERRHSVLTFFFDGVPPLDAPEAAETTDRIPRTREERIAASEYRVQPSRTVTHEPVREKQCDRCHQISSRTERRAGSWLRGTARLLKPPEQLCFDCHELVDPHLHGPASAGQCMICHLAHTGPHPHLLRVADPNTLCPQCHLREDLEATDRHEPGNLEQPCLGCHDPHGGPTPALERELVIDPSGRTRDGQE